ncbi:hypothetical protein [uncultured Sphingomonas sp.]|uniref:hypothetical protein n=1 Tax=uncultured Sphingomonas sp. TaxID=158754 RepID=UPI00374974E2
MMVTMLLLLALAGQETAPASAPQPKKDKVICKKEEATGSRLGGRRICHTRLEWDEIALIARRDVEEAGTRIRGPVGN